MTSASNYLSLGETFEEKGKYFKAERLYRRALKLVEPDVDEKSEELVPYLYNLGMVQAALDKTGDASRNLDRALEILLSRYDDSNSDVREIRLVLDELQLEATGKAVNS